jgi:surfeit locus 1 family protein
LRRLPVGLTVATAIALAILCALGAWQLQRRVWKEQMLADIAARSQAPARPVAAALADGVRGREVEFSHVTAECPGLSSAPYAELYALNEGGTGVRLMSACRLTGAPYDAVLVDRGFVADTVSARPAVNPGDTAPTTVAGVLRKPDKPTFVTRRHQPGDRIWFFRDLQGMGRALGAGRVAPYFLAAGTSTNPEWKALQPLPLPAEIPNRHFEYALTWFGLAAALLGVYGGFVARRFRSRPE